MKRIKNKKKTQKLREDALKELNKTRAHFEKEHPALLETVRQLVKKKKKAEEKQPLNQAKTRTHWRLTGKPHDVENAELLV